MVNTRKRQKKPEDEMEENNEIFEKLKLVVAAETEKIEISQKRKFDEIAEKLQSMEKSMVRIPNLSSNNHSSKKPKSAKEFVLRGVFEVRDEGFSVRSKKEEHFNVKWQMRMKRYESHLGIHVFCYPIAPVEDEWSIETKVEFKMIGKNNNSVIRTKECCFKNKFGLGYKEFLKWKDVKDDYVIDDKLTAEVKVEILKKTGFKNEKSLLFDESQKDVSDVVLVVKDTKFYVSKMYLAAQSAFFKSLFFGNFSESNKSEIPLAGIEPAELQCFLEFIYAESPISDSTVEAILLIADMYDAPTATRRCEDYLLKVSKKEFKKKLQISTQYRLDKLKTQCLSKINKLDDVREHLPGGLSDLDSSVVLTLFQKCVDSQ
ncbi:unnamed protein product [Caenorhabditis nigoni]